MGGADEGYRRLLNILGLIAAAGATTGGRKEAGGRLQGGWGGKIRMQMLVASQGKERASNHPPNIRIAQTASKLRANTHLGDFRVVDKKCRLTQLAHLSTRRFAGAEERLAERGQ